jgi:hypothetical protein
LVKMIERLRVSNKLTKIGARGSCVRSRTTQDLTGCATKRGFTTSPDASVFRLPGKIELNSQTSFVIFVPFCGHSLLLGTRVVSPEEQS